LEIALDGVHGDDEVIAVSVRLDVLQADESLTFLGLPDDRTEILELLVRNIGHLYESLTTETKIREIYDKCSQMLKRNVATSQKNLKNIKF
tara:strand:+ start:256 stop:528 length:273 start_codon:yes stop_codon:yes gene_type:complete